MKVTLILGNSRPGGVLPPPQPPAPRCRLERRCAGLPEARPSNPPCFTHTEIKTTKGEVACPGPRDSLCPSPKPGWTNHKRQAHGASSKEGASFGHPQPIGSCPLPIGAASSAGSKPGKARRPPSKGVGGPSALLRGWGGSWLGSPQTSSPPDAVMLSRRHGAWQAPRSPASRPFPACFHGKT